jgi:hypothetical protein
MPPMVEQLDCATDRGVGLTVMGARLSSRLNTTLIAILARSARYLVVIEDTDFDVLSRLLPWLHVLFYDRIG